MWLLLLLLKSNNGKHFLIETSGDTDIKVNELAGYNNGRNAESGHDYMLPRRGHRDEIMDNTVEELDELIIIIKSSERFTKKKFCLLCGDSMENFL